MGKPRHSPRLPTTINTPADLLAHVRAYRHMEDGAGLYAELYQKLLAAYSEELANFAQRGAGRVACAAGCSMCCHLYLTVPEFEIEVIATHILRTWEPTHIEAAMERMREHSAASAGIVGDAYIALRLACPLLEDNRCAIYETRPLTCATFHSTSVKACQRAFGQAGGSTPFNQAIVLRAIQLRSQLYSALTQIGYTIQEEPFIPALLQRLESGLAGRK